MYRVRHSGWNLRLKLNRRSSWNARSRPTTSWRAARMCAGDSSSARRTSANTEKFRDSSSAPAERAQAVASQIRNSIRPFGVPTPRRIADSE
jgi:hypothetical protein